MPRRPTDRAPRVPLPTRRVQGVPDDDSGLTHEALVAALRGLEGIVDVSGDPPNLHLRGRPFLHFHQHPDGTYADVRFGRGDFEPVWAGTPQERVELLARVAEHVERIARPRGRSTVGQSGGGRRRGGRAADRLRPPRAW